jgi:trk system potassium uptake protein TrkH
VITFFYPERKLAHMRGMIGGGTLRLKQLLLTISVIFSIYTVALSISLYFSGNNDGIYNASLVFSTVTGGGFIPTSTSVGSENTFQLLSIMGGMVVSALPFAFHYALFSKELKTTKMRTEIYLYFGIMLVSTIIFYFFIVSSETPSNLIASAFHVISASTTSGFQYINMQLLSDDGKIILIILMLIGGTAFSTAGGIKVGRVLQIVQKLTSRKFKADNSTRSISSASSRYNKTSHVYEPRTEKLKEEKTFNEAILVIVLFIVMSFVTAMVINNFGKRDFIDSLFESVSALTTTGITTGLTTLDLDTMSKGFLIANMIAGRFEIIAIVYLFLEVSRRKK